jgi:uncharacterized membrane protein
MATWFPVLFWWLAFAGTHLVPSSMAVRRPLIARLGERGFQGLYSLVALGTFIMLVRAYWSSKHAGPLLWNLRGIWGLHTLSVALSGVAFILIAASIVQPSATSMVPGAVTRARGITRVTRHPLFCGLGLWGLAHVLVNGFLSDVIFFGGFFVFWLVGAVHQDTRKRTTAADRLGAFYAETSMLPFAAILAGRTRLVFSEIPWLGVAIGVVGAAALYLLHPRWFMG